MINNRETNGILSESTRHRFVIATKGPEAQKQPHESFVFLNEFREFLSWKRGDAVFLTEEIKDKDLVMELPAYGYDWIRLRRKQEK
jgi:hypothetical protein